MRPVDMVRIAGCLAVLLACQSEPVVGHGAEAVHVATRDTPSPGQQSTPGADTYVAVGGDGHENFGADALLRVERSGDTHSLARWDLDAIAAIPYREGWLLRKADDEAKGSVAFGSRESGAPPRLVLTTGGQEGMPASPPDSFPSAIYGDSTNIVEDSPCSDSPFMRSIVTVVFVEGTTPGQRQAAVDLVEGTVVGGVPLSEQGIYLIQVEDDESGSGVCSAEAALEELPTVDRAAPDDIAETHDRRPRDGAPRSTDAPEPDPVPAHGERAQDDIVPVEAPDTVPEGLYSAENIRRGSACGTLPMLRGIVVVTFEEGTKRAEKQEAIDLVDGEVIGGSRPRDDLEGHYYFRVEESADGQILCDAVETLNALPQVLNATGELFGSAFYRRPDDGGVWSEDAWELDPDSVTTVTAR